MKINRKALLCLSIACSLIIGIMASGLAAESETASVESTTTYGTRYSQGEIGEHIEQQRKNLENHLDWSHEQWKEHIDRSIEFWGGRYTQRKELPDINDVNPDQLSPYGRAVTHYQLPDNWIGNHIQQSSDWLYTHLTNAEQSLGKLIGWTQPPSEEQK